MLVYRRISAPRLRACALEDGRVLSMERRTRVVSRRYVTDGSFRQVSDNRADVFGLGYGMSVGESGEAFSCFIGDYNEIY